MNHQQQPESRQDIEARIISKAWKDESYKQELLSNPKAIFEQEFGVELPEEISVQVLEENSTTLNFVLPMHPETSGHELNESELEAIAGGKLNLPEGAGTLVGGTVARGLALGTLSAGWAITGLDNS